MLVPNIYATATVVKVVRHFSPAAGGKPFFIYPRTRRVQSLPLLYSRCYTRDFGKQASINIRRLIAGKDIMRLAHGNKLYERFSPSSCVYHYFHFFFIFCFFFLFFVYLYNCMRISVWISVHNFFSFLFFFVSFCFYLLLMA